MNQTMKGYTIRKETENDYREVENVTREAFWNVYSQGCSEHYLAHMMRKHPDFVPQLDYVLEKDGVIIGSVMYTKCHLKCEDGQLKPILSMGPICVLPQYQRTGGSRLLLEYTFERAKELGYDVVINFGNPANYINRGYMSCKSLNVCMGEGMFPTALLVKELVPNVLLGKQWQYIPSDVDACCEDVAAVEAFDSAFPKKQKQWMPSQEEFFIYSHSCIVR